MSYPASKCPQGKYKYCTTSCEAGFLDFDWLVKHDKPQLQVELELHTLWCIHCRARARGSMIFIMFERGIVGPRALGKSHLFRKQKHLQSTMRWGDPLDSFCSLCTRRHGWWWNMIPIVFLIWMIWTEHGGAVYMLATWLDTWGVIAAFYHVVVLYCIARSSCMSSMLNMEAVWEKLQTY